MDDGTHTIKWDAERCLFLPLAGWRLHGNKKASVGSMRVFLVIITILTAVGCEDRGSEPMLPPKEEVLPEVAIAGNVLYYVDTVSWTGGEGDPSGFILTDPNWLSGEPTFTYSRIYLKDSTIGSLAGSRVRITGTLDTIWVGGIQTPRRTFPWIGTTDMTVLMKPEYFPNQVGTQWTYEVFDPYVQSYFSMVVTITDTTRVSPTLLLSDGM